VAEGLSLSLPQIEALDFSPAMIEQLKRKVTEKGLAGELHASVQDAQNLPQAWSGKFDAVFCNCTIMFIPDRVKAFQEMYRCLKPGGIAVVTAWSTRRDNPAIGYCYNAIEDAMQSMFKRGDPSDPILAAKIKDHVPIPDRPHPNFVLSNPKLFKQELLYSGFPSVKYVPSVRRQSR
jgi:ubiquinone/menaquinone biosynthesis C-methylase UbiE